MVSLPLYFILRAGKGPLALLKDPRLAAVALSSVGSKYYEYALFLSSPGGRLCVCVCVCAFSVAVITDLEDLFRMAQLYSGVHGFK